MLFPGLCGHAVMLERACKDGISSRFFKCIEQLLLRLYYLHLKSPEKDM